MDLRRLARDIFLVAMGGALAAVVPLAAIKYIVGEKVSRSEFVLSCIIGFIAAAVIVWALLSNLARRLRWEEVAHKTGIVAVFPGISSCQEEIQAAIGNAKSSRIFLHIGTSVLSGAHTMYEFLEKQLPVGAEIRVMHASDSSPYLSPEAARRRPGSDRNKWLADIQYARDQLAALRRRYGDLVQVREHEEPFVWRLLLIDDVAYLQPYLFDTKNAERANILKVVSHGSGASRANDYQSLFDMASRYFDAMWNKYPRKTMSLESLVGSDIQVTYAAIIRIQGHYLFSIPFRHLEQDPQSVKFHLIGGKPQAGENRQQTLRREVQEETGLPIRIRSASNTVLVDGNNAPSEIKLTDQLAPRIVRKRTEDGVLWTVGYSVAVRGQLRPHPKAETAALLVLSPEMFQRAKISQLTVDDVRQSTDGSRLMARSGVEIGGSLRLVPAGLAPFIQI